MKQFAYASGSSVVVTGSTERGVKNAASRNGSTTVGYVSKINNMFIETHKKCGSKWIEI